ncbi:hypothetical protein Avbf_09636, partial [Armadillidium vulgare]
MKPIVDSIECQRDSPYFRHVLEENEKNIEVLECKLEKIIKQCTQMVNIGKTFNMEQEEIKTLKEKRHHFDKNSQEFDGLLLRFANTSKVPESDEMYKQVWAMRQAFRHTCLDYAHALSMLQAKKRHEVVDA